MDIMSKNRLREKFKKNETAYGLWVTLESPSITEMAATLGLDWVCVEMEHGHLDYGDIMEHLRAVRGSPTTILVRIQETQQGIVKRVLDMGAHGIILPLIRNHAEVQQAMDYARYPMRGVRGLGGERAVKWGLDFQNYLKSADEETLIIPMIELRDAVNDIDSILQVPGLEALFFGPADLSASYGHLGEWEGNGVSEKIIEVKNKAQSKGIVSGIMSRSVGDSLLRRDQGFQMIGLGSDIGLIVRAVNDNLESLGHTPTPHLWF